MEEVHASLGGKPPLLSCSNHCVSEDVADGSCEITVVNMALPKQGLCRAISICQSANDGK